MSKDEDYIECLEITNEQLHAALAEKSKQYYQVLEALEEAKKEPQWTLAQNLKWLVDNKNGQLAQYFLKYKCVNNKNRICEFNFGRCFGHTTAALELMKQRDCVYIVHSVREKELIKKSNRDILSVGSKIITVGTLLKGGIAPKDGQIFIFDCNVSSNKNQILSRFESYNNPFVLLFLQ